MSDNPPMSADYPMADPGTTTAEAAKQQASSVADDAKGQTQQVAAHAAQETKQVAGQAASQLMDLLSQSRAELAGQASGQQQRLAQGLRSVGAELDQMRGGSQSAGLATETASQLAGRIHQAADFLEQRDFTAAVDELADFARRRPGVFLLGAGLLGVVAGRLTRGLRADSGRPSPQPVISHPRGADPVSVPDAAGTYVNTPSSYASEGGGVSGGTYAADELTSPVPTEAYTEAADEDAGQRR